MTRRAIGTVRSALASWVPTVLGDHAAKNELPPVVQEGRAVAAIPDEKFEETIKKTKLLRCFCD